MKSIKYPDIQIRNKNKIARISVAEIRKKHVLVTWLHFFLWDNMKRKVYTND